MRLYKDFLRIYSIHGDHAQLEAVWSALPSYLVGETSAGQEFSREFDRKLSPH
jgi:hypothetical protein